MANSVGVINTATDPVTGARAIVPAPLNFAADFRVQSEKPGEVVLTNIRAKKSAPETIRIANSQIADIFKGSSLIPADTCDCISGSSTLIQLNTMVLDSMSQFFPVSANIVLRLPDGVEFSDAEYQTLLGRLLGALYDTGSTAVLDRIKALCRGAVVPVDL